jgi:hypothetical protein
MTSKKSQFTADSIRRILQLEGSLSARELVERLGISQPTFSRVAAELPDLVRFGGSRRTQYALKRELRTHGSSWPLYRVTESGNVVHDGEILCLHGNLFGVDLTDIGRQYLDVLCAGEFRDGLFPGVPWFLDEMRPQGFLGRIFAHTRAETLNLPRDLERWTNDDAMVAMLHTQTDAPGHWIVGEEAARIFQRLRLDQPEESKPQAAREQLYPAIVDELTDPSRLPGSSAGGEQPKFSIRRGNRAVIVKFSGPMDNANGRRWADLLALEHLAAQLLSQAGVAAVTSRIFDFGDRRYLEVDRFDRVGAFGRRGITSLRALDSAHGGGVQSRWSGMAASLHTGGWISAETLQIVRRLELFGSLIGNNDMHAGNLSCFLGPKRPLELAPVYDMLPMRYAPSRAGDIFSSPLSFDPPLPQELENWAWASQLACEYWESAAACERLTEEMRTLCQSNHDELRRIGNELL